MKIQELFNKPRIITPQQKFELNNMKECVDCGKKVSRKSIRCKKCAYKNRDNIKLAKNFGNTKGKNNPRWKGNDVGYYALHKWIRKVKPKPLCCERCAINKKLEIANLSGEYKRDIKDFEWLCRSCHRKMDFKNKKRDKRGRFIR